MGWRGFTLVELMVVVAIAAILAVAGGITMSSRMAVNRLEQAAQSLRTDLSAARSAALFKGCPTRLIFCEDVNCESVVEGPGGSEAPEEVAAYAVLRLSHNDEDERCYNEEFVAGDGFGWWDYERRPQDLPRGVAIDAIYNEATANNWPTGSDWGWPLSAGTNQDDADKSLWFSSRYGELNLPHSHDGELVFQVRLENCTAGESDCHAFHITLDEGGEADVSPCGTDECI